MVCKQTEIRNSKRANKNLRSCELIGHARQKQIKISFVGRDRTFGARRGWHDLLADGAACGVHRVERPMRGQAWRDRPRRCGLSSDKGTWQEAADNLRDR